VVISWMSGEEGYCIHAEHLESSAHASCKVFPNTLAVICGQDQVKSMTLTIMRFGNDSQPKTARQEMNAA
jgi:hypothetical protein